MKKNAIRILSLLLVIMTLVGVISLPVSAYSYPMNYTITYKTKDGKTLGTNSGYLNGNSVDCFKCLSGITVINLKKTQLNVLPELVKEIENLRTNDFVRRSNTLHLKQSKINMVTLFVLLQDYSQEDLINLIPRIPAYIDRDFYTISYLKRLLKKAMKGDTI